VTLALALVQSWATLLMRFQVWKGKQVEVRDGSPEKFPGVWKVGAKEIKQKEKWEEGERGAAVAHDQVLWWD